MDSLKRWYIRFPYKHKLPIHNPLNNITLSKHYTLPYHRSFELESENGATWNEGRKHRAVREPKFKAVWTVLESYKHIADCEGIDTSWCGIKGQKVRNLLMEMRDAKLWPQHNSNKIWNNLCTNSESQTHATSMWNEFSRQSSGVFNTKVRTSQ